MVVTPVGLLETMYVFGYSGGGFRSVSRRVEGPPEPGGRVKVETFP